MLAIGTPFIPSIDQLRPFVVELTLIGGMIAVLLFPLFGRRSNVASGLLAVAAVLAAAIGLLLSGGQPMGESFRGMLLSDPMSVYWKLILLTFTLGILVMWFAVTRPAMHAGDAPEYFTLLLCAVLGMSLMSSTSNLLMIIIAMETASLPSYVLAGFRKNSRLGAEASLKYILFGAVSSSVMIYGISMLYGLYGTLQIDGPDGIAAQISRHGGVTPLLMISLTSILVGLGFKLSVVPMHFWCPDVFEGAGTEIAAFLSVASKGAALILLTRIAMSIAQAMGFQNGSVNLTLIAAVLGSVGAITATIGNTAAFTQNNVKRLLAWSSIAHAGYMLCALSLLVVHSAEVMQGGKNVAVQAILIYLTVYAFMNLGAFLVVGLVGRQGGGEDLYAFKGLSRRSPALAASMAIFLFSLVGLPPFAGFTAKLNVMWRLADNGGWWWALVAVIGVNTVFSLYYYARVVRAMYLESSEQPEFTPNPAGTGLAMACAVVLILLFLGFNAFDRVTGNASHLIDTPAAITATR